MATTQDIERAPRPPCQTRAFQPYCFLDLPKEIRIMVYEQVEYSTTTYEIKGLYSAALVDMAIVSKSLSTALLATSRSINAEAKSCIESKLEILRESERFNIICYMHASGSTIMDRSHLHASTTNRPVTLMDYIHQECIDKTSPGSSSYGPPSLYGRSGPMRSPHAGISPEYDHTRSFIGRFCDLLLGVHPRTTTAVLRFPGKMGPASRLANVQRVNEKLPWTRVSIRLEGNVRIVAWEDYCGGSIKEEGKGYCHFRIYDKLNALKT